MNQYKTNRSKWRLDMLRSNVIDYAAIAMAESRNSGIFDQDYLAGITVLGFNELVENGFITIDGNCKIHCNEITDTVPEYLKPLEEAIRKEDGKELRNLLMLILSDMTGRYCDKIEKYMEKEGLINITYKKKLGIETPSVQVMPQYVQECKECIRNIAACEDEKEIVFLYVLLRTNMLDDIITKDEIKKIKNKMQNVKTEKDTCTVRMIKMADEICTLALSILATMMLV